MWVPFPRRNCAKFHLYRPDSFFLGGNPSKIGCSHWLERWATARALLSSAVLYLSLLYNTITHVFFVNLTVIWPEFSTKLIRIHDAKNRPRSLCSTTHLFSSIAITSNPWVYSGLPSTIAWFVKPSANARQPTPHQYRLNTPLVVPAARDCSACHLMNVNRSFAQYPIRTLWFCSACRLVVLK